jgi:hypothetical protein
MAETIPSVIVIDDDSAIRESIGALLRSVGLQAKLFASVDEFFKAGRPDGPACLVLDVRLWDQRADRRCRGRPDARPDESSPGGNPVIPAEPMVRRLPAGGREIRTLGPSREDVT